MESSERYLGGTRKTAPPAGPRLCRLCGQRSAKFCYRGRMKADRHHDLCQQCFRSLEDRNRSRQLVTGCWVLPLWRDS